MYKGILVPPDGSNVAEQILPYVSAIAVKFGSTVTLVQAITPDRSHIPPSVGVVQADDRTVDRPNLNEAERQQAAHYLAKIARHLRAAGVLVNMLACSGQPGAQSSMRRAGYQPT